MVNEIALKTVLFITFSVLLPSHLPVIVAKAQFLHEDRNSCSSACSEAALLHKNHPATAQVCSRALVFASQWRRIGRSSGEQGGKGNGALEPHNIPQDVLHYLLCAPALPTHRTHYSLLVIWKASGHQMYPTSPPMAGAPLKPVCQTSLG